jgi:hypothetical protein
MPMRRNYLSIYQDGKTRLQNNTPVNNFNQTGVTKGFLDILSVEMEKLYDNIEFLYGAFDPTRAAGSGLDKVAYLVGEDRSTAVVAADYSNTNFYFYLDSRLNWTIQQLIEKNYTLDEIDILENDGFIVVTNGVIESLMIPQGTIVSNTNQSIVYTTINDTVLLSNADTYVGIVAGSTGPSSNVETNVLISHNIQGIPQLRKIANFIRCSNRYPIQSGRYSFNDAQLRYLVSTSRSAKATNELAIRRAALSIQGVRDIMFEKNKFGNGTVNLIVDGTSPLLSQGLIDAIKESVQQSASFGDLIFVTAPSYIGVELNFDVIVDPIVTDPLAIRNTARNAVIDYINNLPLGGEIIWNQLVTEVGNVAGVKDFIPNYFKLGDYDAFNKINKNQIVLRYTNQKANTSEKFYCDSGLICACIAQ